ncbi:hypothetical protein [Nonomuraea sp. NPDC049480]|uniref:hypothetical protein n=1 Tax=Nonomuraea sp. NPDC049480 TaxID=3364353 RepID=UPI00379B035C
MRAVTLNSVPETPAMAEVDTPRPEAGEPGSVSLNAVALAEGETVLISGAAGGVGSLAAQLAAARPAEEGHGGVRRLRREHPAQDRHRLLLTSIASRKEI